MNIMEVPTVTPTTDKPQTRLAMLKQLIAIEFDKLPPAESTRMMESIQNLAEVTDYSDAKLETHLEAMLKDFGVLS
jgi:hypothetical protein